MKAYELQTGRRNYGIYAEMIESPDGAWVRKEDVAVGSEPEIEQMVRWLCANENHFMIITSNFDVCIYSACMGTTGNPPIGKGPTLRAALQSAIDHVQKKAKQ